MSGLGDLLALIHDADRSWTTVRGTVHEWWDQLLVHQAFLEALDSLPPSWSGRRLAFTSAASDRPPVSDSTYQIWVDRSRVRVERPATPDGRPELLVRDGPVWWSFKTGRGAFTNGGTPNEAGGDEIRLDLAPYRTLSQFKWELVGTELVASRACLAARAERRPLGSHEIPVPPFSMAMGGDQFDVAVDRERGVLLRVVKLVGGQPAHVREFVDITFDERLEDSLFQFISPDGSPIQDIGVNAAGLREEMLRKMRNISQEAADPPEGR